MVELQPETEFGTGMMPVPPARQGLCPRKDDGEPLRGDEGRNNFL